MRPDPGPAVGGIGARVFEYGFPVFGREGRIRSRGDGPRGLRPAAAASFSICFGVGMRQLAGRSVIPN